MASPAPSADTIRLFVSHSSKDADLVSALMQLVGSALHLPSSQIRCTSLEGFRLPGGSVIDDQLRSDVLDSEAFLGVLSESSIHSVYVMFEMGARWAGKKHLLPLLAPGTTPGLLEGPLATLNPLRVDSIAQLHQLVQELAGVLGLRPDSPAVYHQHIDTVMALSSELLRKADRTPEEVKRIAAKLDSVSVDFLFAASDVPVWWPDVQVFDGHMGLVPNSVNYQSVYRLLDFGLIEVEFGKKFSTKHVDKEVFLGFGYVLTRLGKAVQDYLRSFHA